MPIEGKAFNTSSYNNVSHVYLRDGREALAIYMPLDGIYSKVYEADTDIISGTSPLSVPQSQSSTLYDYKLYGVQSGWNATVASNNNCIPVFNCISGFWLADTDMGTGINETVVSVGRMTIAEPISISPVSNSTIYASFTAHTGATIGVVKYYFYDASDNYISSASQSFNSMSVANQSVAVPSGATKLRISTTNINNAVIANASGTHNNGGATYTLAVNGSSHLIYVPAVSENLSLSDRDYIYVHRPPSLITITRPSSISCGTGTSNLQWATVAGNTFRFANAMLYASQRYVQAIVAGAYHGTTNLLSEGEYTLAASLILTPPSEDFKITVIVIGYEDWTANVVLTPDNPSAKIDFTCDGTNVRGMVIWLSTESSNPVSITDLMTSITVVHKGAYANPIPDQKLVRADGSKTNFTWAVDDITLTSGTNTVSTTAGAIIKAHAE